MSDTPKHTPGPWKWTGRYGQNNLLGADGQLVMFGVRGGLYFEGDSALIAAAPEMLNALIMVLDDPNALDRRPRTAEIVYSAIAKAQGRTP